MTPSAPFRQTAGSTAAAVGAKIRLRCQQRGMSAAEMARRAGLSKATLSQPEAGNGNPTIDTLDAIAIALRIPIADLLARDADTGPVFRPGTDAEPGEVSRELLRRISSGNSLEIWRFRRLSAYATRSTPVGGAGLGGLTYSLYSSHDEYRDGPASLDGHHRQEGTPCRSSSTSVPLTPRCWPPWAARPRTSAN
ncbi:helix-turn-helix domain-containing protein [Streptomyces sp. NPDC059262]|uniref:helix-turn-helix domain-containing protein n=1 Tax=Streptomyces sp. NPDC059262 TaxID=3346797 RepID=UPI0036B28386